MGILLGVKLVSKLSVNDSWASRMIEKRVDLFLSGFFRFASAWSRVAGFSHDEPAENHSLTQTRIFCFVMACSLKAN
jgi:hypothetical protein